MLSKFLTAGQAVLVGEAVRRRVRQQDFHYLRRILIRVEAYGPGTVGQRLLQRLRSQHAHSRVRLLRRQLRLDVRPLCGGLILRLLRRLP